MKGRRERFGDELFVSDLSVCEPKTALDREHRAMAWRLVDYETEDGLQGVMVHADPELGAPELKLPLGVDGTYKIYLGINYTKSGYAYRSYGSYGNLDVKLTGDRGYTHVAAEQSPVKQPTVRGEAIEPKIGKGKFVPRSIQEVYWRTADLTGQSLLFRPPGEPYRWVSPQISNLSYVRLVPVTTKGLHLAHELEPSDETRRLAFIYCTGNLSGHIDKSLGDFHVTDSAWFETEFRPCVSSDVGVFVLEAIRGSYCIYPSRIGDVGGPDNRWDPAWIDPVEAFTELAHENGVKLFASFRMIGASYPTSRDPLSRARFYWDNQQWAKRDRNGRPTGNLSIAFPEVRAYWLSLLSEVLEYGIDGIAVYLHRFRPFVLYEEPAIESFVAQFGVDPRQLADYDPRWLSHRAAYVTSFLREIRDLVDERPGRELAVLFHGGPSDYVSNPDTWNPMQETYDVEAWINQRLPDYLMPTQRTDPAKVMQWSEIAGGALEIWPELESWDAWGPDQIELAERYYEAGATGFSIWDAERQAPRISEWAVTSRLGHRESLARLKQETASCWRRVPVKYLAGMATMYSFNNYAHRDPLLHDDSAVQHGEFD